MTRRKVNKDWNGSDGEPKAPLVPKDEKTPVRIHLVWEGTHKAARRTGQMLKRIIQDLEGEGDRIHALRLRKAWREATEEAGVQDA